LKPDGASYDLRLADIKTPDERIFAGLFCSIFWNFVSNMKNLLEFFCNIGACDSYLLNNDPRLPRFGVAAVRQIGTAV
jgi:hypothetical protein